MAILALPNVFILINRSSSDTCMAVLVRYSLCSSCLRAFSSSSSLFTSSCLSDQVNSVRGTPRESAMFFLTLSANSSTLSPSLHSSSGSNLQKLTEIHSVESYVQFSLFPSSIHLPQTDLSQFTFNSIRQRFTQNTCIIIFYQEDFF